MPPCPVWTIFNAYFIDEDIEPASCYKTGPAYSSKNWQVPGLAHCFIGCYIHSWKNNE